MLLFNTFYECRDSGGIGNIEFVQIDRYQFETCFDLADPMFGN